MADLTQAHEKVVGLSLPGLHHDVPYQSSKNTYLPSVPVVLEEVLHGLSGVHRDVPYLSSSEKAQTLYTNFGCFNEILESSIRVPDINFSDNNENIKSAYFIDSSPILSPVLFSPNPTMYREINPNVVPVQSLIKSQALQEVPEILTTTYQKILPIIAEKNGIFYSIKWYIIIVFLACNNSLIYTNARVLAVSCYISSYSYSISSVFSR